MKKDQFSISSVRLYLRFLFFLTFFIVIAQTTFAQVSKSSFYKKASRVNTIDVASLRFKHYNSKNGLSQATINDLIQDTFGFVWLATQNGLYRFDGEEFKYFRPTENDSTTISGRYVNKLFEDNKGNIWIGTAAKGLCYYDRVKEKFHRVTLNESQVHSEIITDITQDEYGQMWVNSGISGLFKLHFNDQKKVVSKKILFSEHSLSALYTDFKNNLWVGDWNGKIYKFDSLDKEFPLKSEEVQLKGAIRSFLRINENLFVGTDIGLYKYHIPSKKIQLLELSSVKNSEVNYIKELLPNLDQATFWVSTSKGLLLFDHKSGQVIATVKKAIENQEGLSSNQILSLLRLDKTKLLIGTENGLDELDFGKPVFKGISKNNKGKHLLNENMVFALFKDKKDLWVGTASNGGLNLIRNDSTYYFKEDPDNPSSISSNIIRSIVKDTVHNRLWIATSKGLSMVDLKTFSLRNPEFKVFQHDKNNPNSINEDFIKDIALDKDNNLWGVTFSKGVFRLKITDNMEDISINRYVHNENDGNSIPSNITNCIDIDTKNNIWIGSVAGLTQFKSEGFDTPVFSNYFVTDKEGSSLSHNIIYDILVDEKDRVWVGTRDGLNLFLGDNEFRSWRKQKQFPNTMIHSIQNDKQGDLWLGTLEGLSRFNPETEEFAYYSVDDGIQGNEFNIHSKFCDEDGQVFMNGMGGVTHFYPEDVKNLDEGKKLYFSQLKIKKEIITPKDSDSSVLEESIINTSKLDLSYDQFPFYLNFSTINFEFNKNGKYAYRLLGQDEEWRFLDNKEIQFLNLQPGKYTLQVNGFSRGNQWKQKPLEIVLQIYPPWYRTWWVYILYILTAVMVVLLILKWRSRSLQKKNKNLESLIKERTTEIQHKNTLLNQQTEQLEELNESKTRLYSNITHEFRTPLTVILGMVDTLKSNHKKEVYTEAEKSLNMIKRNGSNLLHLVNELLDLAKVESGSLGVNLVQTDIIPFVKYLSESFHSLAEAKKINLTVYSEVDTLIMDVDTNKVASIVSNLLSNAVKFTAEGGAIIVHLNEIEEGNDSFFVIKVKDDGLGLSKENLENLFDRFYQANSNNYGEQVGTGIGLALTKEFVELLKGTITVESVIDKGTTFTVQLPVTNIAVAVSGHTEIVKSPVLEPVIASKNTFLIEEKTSDVPLVLIIEDNEDVAHYLKVCLKEKYEVIHALDGEDGIKMAFEHLPDIIISDVMMPRKDGYEVCSILKEDERTDHIPIILLTAKVTTEDRLTGLTQGADAYLTKPFNQEELFIRLNQLILVRKNLIKKLEKNGFASVLKEKEESPQNKFLRQVIMVINENLDNSDFGASHLANALHLSESQVYRKLKTITNKSTAVFIRSVRLQKAKEYIQSSEKTISEISYEVGFKDPSWFSRAFKDEFGYPPSDLLK